MMTKQICMFLAMVGMAVAGCNSDRNAGSGDTLATDTNMIDTMTTDSAGMVDSAVSGSGTTTGGAGNTTGGDGAGSSTGTNNGQGTGSGAGSSSGNNTQGTGSGTGNNSGNSGQ